MIVCDLDKRNGGGGSGATAVVFVPTLCPDEGLAFDGDGVANGDFLAVDGDALPAVVQDGSMANSFPSRVPACL